MHMEYKNRHLDSELVQTIIWRLVEILHGVNHWKVRGLDLKF